MAWTGDNFDPTSTPAQAIGNSLSQNTEQAYTCSPMRKFNFIIGALSGVFGGMLMSNKKLRQKLKEADDPKEAARIIGKEMQHSGKQVAQETQDFVRSEEFQSWWKKTKKNLSKQCKNLQEKAGSIACDASQKAQNTVKKKFKK